ncbi:hypothetical protein SNK04_013849 [Fusarium graminearum]
MSCTEYLKLYKESWGRLLESSPRLVSYEDRAMYSTWNISYQNVEKRNKSSAMLLRLWAYFDHDDLWYELCVVQMNRHHHGCKPLQTKLLLRKVCDYCATMD